MGNTKKKKIRRTNWFDVVGKKEKGDYGCFVEYIYHDNSREMVDDNARSLIKNYSWRKAKGRYLYVKKKNKLHAFWYVDSLEHEHKRKEVPEGKVILHDNYISIVQDRRIVAVYTLELKLVMLDEEEGITISGKDKNGTQWCRSGFTGEKKELPR